MFSAKQERRKKTTNKNGEEQKEPEYHRKTLEVNQKEILMWVFRWMAKVPGHFVTQQAMMLPGL